MAIKNTILVADGAEGTAGQVLTSAGAGSPPTFETASGGISALVDDTTPQLGGDLDVNGKAITSAAGLDVSIGGSAGNDFTIDTDKLVVEGDSGRVGIGTATPKAQLDVTTAGGVNMRLTDTTASEYTELSQHGSDGAFTINRLGTGGDDFGIKADGTVYLGMTGDTGINTNSPEAKLHVVASGDIARFQDPTAAGNICLAARSGGTVNPIFTIKWENDDGGVYIAAKIACFNDGGEQGGDLRFQTAAAGVLSEQMRITKDGNVGIGTTSPEYELDVNGFTNTKSIHEVSKEGLVLGMNFNSENITGSAGSETVLDSSTYNNHGTNHGATYDPDGGFNGGGAFSLDGVDDYIKTEGALAVNTETTSYTISFWMFKEGTTGVQLVFAASFPVFAIVFEGTSHLKAYLNGHGTAVNMGDIINEWHHVTVVYTANAVAQPRKVYLDGVYIGSDVATAGGNYTGSNSINIGGDSAWGSYSTFFEGPIDNLQVHNRALSADEIKALYLQRAEVQDSFVSKKDVFVDSDSNVGIGTTTPLASLDVAGEANSIRITDTRNTTWGPEDQLGSLEFFSQDTSNDGPRIISSVKTINDVAGTGNTSPSGSLAFYTALNGETESEKLRIKSNGNVGIGTTSPTSKLDIVQTGNTSGLSVYSNVNADATEPLMSLTADNTLFDEYILSIVNDGTKGSFINQSGDLTADRAGLRIYANTTFTGTNSSLFQLYDQGADNTKSAAFIRKWGTGEALKIDKNNSGYGIDIDGDANSTSDLIGLRVNVANTGTGEAYGAIFETGNVGIGTTSPDEKLDVDGKIATSGGVVERVVTTASDTTAVIDCTVTDEYQLTAMAGATTFSFTGTPSDGQKILISFKDDGTTRALTWTGFTAIGVTLPTTTTVGKWHYVGVKYNSSASAWHVLATSVEA